MRQERNMGADAIALQNSAKAAATASPCENQIATVAYQLWLERGCPHGSDQEDWFRAEAMLKNALTMKGGDQSETLDEFVSAIWQEGHWEVWEREWLSARWVPDLRNSRVGVANPACCSGKAA